LGSLSAVLFLLAQTAAWASPYRSGCVEGEELARRASKAFSAEVVSRSEDGWTYQLEVQDVFLGEPGELQVALSPNPMDPCHPDELELGSHWLVMFSQRGYLPSHSRALVRLPPGGPSEALSVLGPLFAEQQRWARADTAELVALHSEADQADRGALQQRVSMRKDLNAEAFWLHLLRQEPAALSVSAAQQGLEHAASDETLAELVAELGEHPVTDRILLVVLERRHPRAAVEPLAAAYASESLDPTLRKKLLRLLPLMGLPTELSLELLAGTQDERRVALAFLARSADPGCLHRLIELAADGSGLASQALVEGYLHRDATRAATAAALLEATYAGATFSPDVQGTLGEAALLQGELEAAERMLRVAMGAGASDRTAAEANYWLAWLLMGTGREALAAEEATRLRDTLGDQRVCASRLPSLRSCRRADAAVAATRLLASLDAPLRLSARYLSTDHDGVRYELVLSHEGSERLLLQAYPTDQGTGWWPARFLWAEGSASERVASCNAVYKLLEPGERWLLPVQVSPADRQQGELHFDARPWGAEPLPLWTLLIPSERKGTPTPATRPRRPSWVHPRHIPRGSARGEPEVAIALLEPKLPQLVGAALGAAEHDLALAHVQLGQLDQAQAWATLAAADLPSVATARLAQRLERALLDETCPQVEMSPIDPEWSP